MRIIDYLQMTSIELNQDKYDDYDLVIKKYECDIMEYKELFRINYQSYINAFEEEDLRRYLGEYADLEVKTAAIYSDVFLIYIK